VILFKLRADTDLYITVPDLAFSEMDFLQLSNRQASVLKEDKISSMSREKEKRKAARAQDEISTFFKPSKMPLQPNKLNKRSFASTDAKDRRSGHTGVEPDFLRPHYERSQSFDVPKKPNLGLGRAKPTSDILSESLRCSPTTSRPQNVVDSASKLSGRAMSYVSWSETQLSQGTTSRDLSKIGRTRESPTPESIRRALEKTGIFRNTGISMAAQRAALSHDTYQRPSKRGQRRINAIISVSASADSPASTRRIIPCARAGSRELNSPPSGYQPDVLEEAEAANTKDGMIQPDAGIEEGRAMKRKRVVVEYFDLVSGWHERPMLSGNIKAISALATKGDVPHQSESTPMSREELAKIARIKRPSTTRPLEQMSLIREGPMVRSSSDHRVGQEPNQQTLASDMVDVILAPRPDGFKEELENNAAVTVLPSDPSQPGALLSHHHRVDDQPASDLARTGKELLAAPHLSRMINPELGHEELFELQNGIVTLHRNNSSYIGLPVRGFSTGQGPLQTAYHGSPSPVADPKPNFIHQLQRQSAPYQISNYEDHLRNAELDEFEILVRARDTKGKGFGDSKIPEENLSNFHAPADDYLDIALQQTYEEFEGPSEGPDGTDLWHLTSPHVEMGLEHYELEELGQENYEENQLMENGQTQHALEHDYTRVMQEDDYERYSFERDNYVQGFWRPHHY
jgi:hypothetical protein